MPNIGDAEDSLWRERSRRESRLLVIFDCDGVLVDSEPLTAQVTARALTELGWPLTTEEVMARFLGCTDEYFQAEITAHLGSWSSKDWRERVEPEVDRLFESELQPVDGVVELLDALAVHGVPSCVASNGSHTKMERTLGLTGLAARFEGRIFSAHDVRRGKPHPDLFLRAAEQMDTAPADCVVVEDSPRGVEAARAAGMRCLAFAGHTPPTSLRRDEVEVLTSMSGVADRLRVLAGHPG